MNQYLNAKKKKKEKKTNKKQKNKKEKQRHKTFCYSLTAHFFKSEEVSVKNHSQKPKKNYKYSPCLRLSS